MKYLGIDYGEKKIGLSLAEDFLAEPLGVIKARNWQLKIKEICQKYEIEKIVLGISEGKTALKTKIFGQKLAKVCQLPVEFYDETLTSHDALAKMREIGKKTSQEDAFAATVILQNYLDNKKNV